jgi:protein-ribulosamine 3-kinase
MTNNFSTGLQNWLEGQESGTIINSAVQTGGCINDAYTVATENGQKFFIKQNRHAPEAMFDSEAKSLKLLATSHSLSVPEPFYWDNECLLMEYIEPGPKKTNYWEEFGVKLAAMHQTTRNSFGLEFQTYCGTTPQTNNYQANGYLFFTEQRLLPLANKARVNGYFKNEDATALERLCSRLPELIPIQPASLIHGDLWAGNAHVTPSGEPALIDPALYFGWREAEIAMTCLFGGFPNTFYQAYQQTWPLEKGWEQRTTIYNLYHLLNHLNLFGSGYLSQVRQLLKPFSQTNK